MVTGDPILSAYQKTEGTKNNRFVAFYKEHPRLVVGSLFAFLLLVFLWGRRGSTLNSVEQEYSIVFDAGSTGSRVHVYRFDVAPDGSLILRNDDFHQLRPGLSSYAGKDKGPAEAADSLTPLLDAISDSVPKSHISETPCQLKATAGLRLLGETEAANILKAVQQELEETPYSVGEDAATILDGEYEGAYAWLTLNYLLEKLDGKGETVSTIDLGGGSVQESYKVKDGKPDSQSMVSVRSGSTKHSVYVHSYLNFGLMAARSQILNQTQNGKNNPCLPKGTSVVYQYGGVDYKAINGGSYAEAECREMIKKVMRVDDGCPDPTPIEECTFDGVWGGPIARARNTRPLYLFSYFWDRALDAGIITSSEATTWSMKADAYKDKSKIACAESVEQLKTKFTSVDESQLPYLCMDLNFISVLLLEGFKVDPTQDVYLAKQIKYRGENIETSWTLGAAIDSMSTA